MKSNWFARLALFGTVLGFCVVVLGGYVRLSDAGLGCPDWPGCYGHLSVPSAEQDIDKANSAFPHRPVESGKAWKEMIHRYVAGALGMVILMLTILAWRNRSLANQRLFTTSLLGLVIFQALLGMWTVTHLVNPTIVTSHLLAGMTTVALVWWLALGGYFADRRHVHRWRWPVVIGLIILVLQIFLGGWTSTNYAALACTSFPGCYQGQMWPQMDFAEGFILWRPLGVNYEFGVLDPDARAAVHMVHRIGALVTLIYLGWLGIKIVLQGSSATIKSLGYLLLAALTLQVGLGITNVVAGLPLMVAVAHNGGALLLSLVLVTLLYFSNKEEA